MADHKYKDVPRHRAVLEYENAFKSDFRDTVKAAIKEMATTMTKMVSKS